MNKLLMIQAEKQTYVYPITHFLYEKKWEMDTLGNIC